MNRSRVFIVWLCLCNLLLLGTNILVSAQAGEPVSTQFTDADTGFARLIAFETGALGMPARDPETAALGVSSDAVARYASAFGATSNSGFVQQENIIENAEVSGGARAVRYAQTLGGVPVYGAQLVVNVRGDGALLSVSGEVTPTDASALNLTPAISSAAAGLSAVDYVARRYGVAAETLLVEDAGLWVYDPAIIKPARTDERVGLVWQTVISSLAGQPLRVVALVDAGTGSVRFSFNRIHASVEHGDWASARAAGVEFTAGAIHAPSLAAEIGPRVPGTADLATYDANNLTALPGTLLCTEANLGCTTGADPDADSAHFHANGTYLFYWNTHGRDSLNDAGLQLRSTVHFDDDYCNAFWNGTQMAYGDGCNIVIDDVVGHELTHGVTEFSSDLIYAYDSGAINESFSDVWGEYYDLGNGTAEDIPANRWVVGEEIQAGGFRNMKTPTVFSDPDRVGSPVFWTDARDTGGVHINSGINNKAAYLMADGDTFNSQTITGLGLVKPLHIYYYVQTMLATSGSDYNDLGVYLAQACDALVGGAAGITAGDCAEVDKIVLATEMALPSPHLPDSADVCTGGLVADDVFLDTFESAGTSATNWTTGATLGANAWSASSTTSPISGTRSMRADNLTNLSDSTSAMTNGIVVPANAYLHFQQKYLWEYDGWDGGVVQYRLGAGAWTTFTNAQMEGEEYPGLMEFDSSAAFAGETAFTGDSFGVGSTRISLAAFAGQTLRIRFYASSDEFFDQGNPDGWWIDNLRVYTCETAPVSGITVSPTMINAEEGGTTGIYTVVLDSAPSADATVTISPNAQVSTNVTSLTFTTLNWNVAQTVTVTAVDDAINEGAHSGSISHSASGGGTNSLTIASVTVNITDNDEPVPGTNLLINGGFETAGANAKQALGWTGVSLANKDKRVCDAVLGGGIAHEGLCAFRFKAGSTFAVPRTLSQNVTDGVLGAADDTLTLSLYAKTSNFNGVKVKIKVKYVGGGKAKLKLNIPAGTIGYTLRELDYTLTGTVDAVLVTFPVLNSGALFVDDVSLIVEAAPGRGSDVLPPPAVPDSFRGNN